MRSALLLLLVLGCGGTQSEANEPQTAKEKQLAEAKKSGELDDTGNGGKWAGWKYQGDKNACHYVLGRRCFKTEKAACSAAACKSKCDVVGGGPATVSCHKVEKPEKK